MEVAMVGSSSLRVGRGDDPDVEVSIRVFIGRYNTREIKRNNRKF
jgi:hypothetical protein